MIRIDFEDWLFGLFWSFFCFFIYNLYWRSTLSSEDCKRYRVALIIKFLGVFVFSFLHAYVFKQGDCFAYLEVTRAIRKLFTEDLYSFFSMFLDNDPYYNYSNKFNLYDDIYFREENFFACKIMGLFSVFSGAYLIPVSIMLSIFSFEGQQKLVKYISLVTGFDVKKIQLIFYLPSIVIWSSGLSKDNIAFGALCFFVAGVLKFFYIGKVSWKNIVITLFSLWVLIHVKVYLGYISLGFCALYAIVMMKSLLPGRLLGRIYIFTLFVIGLLLTALNFQAIQNSAEKMMTEQMQDRLLNTARGNAESNAGSAYDLGVDFTQIRDIYSIAPYFPISIMTSLYRPFPWENFSIKTLLTILENLLLLFMTILALIKSRFKLIYKSLLNPLLFFCLGMSLTIGLIAGFTSGNFGTLVRYRMPILPFFILFLLIHIHNQYKIHFQSK